jgi:low affinity Fe/Cu permease
MKTKQIVSFVVMMILAIICALSAPAFEIVPQKYGLISLAGFIILFSVFVKCLLTDDGR